MHAKNQYITLQGHALVLDDLLLLLNDFPRQCGSSISPQDLSLAFLSVIEIIYKAPSLFFSFPRGEKRVFRRDNSKTKSFGILKLAPMELRWTKWLSGSECVIYVFVENMW